MVGPAKKLGRPVIGTGHRQHIGTCVAPETYRELHREAKSLGMSIGQVIDRWAKKGENP